MERERGAVLILRGVWTEQGNEVGIAGGPCTVGCESKERHIPVLVRQPSRRGMLLCITFQHCLSALFCRICRLKL